MSQPRSLKLRGCASLLVLLFLLVAVALMLARRTGSPVRQGEQPLAGLEAEVTVRFDRWGVPHVEAASEEDLAAALGWLHANDRLTQMMLSRRAARGRLSEILGDVTVEVDKDFLRLGLGRNADRSYAAAAPTSRAWLEAYAHGVNAWLAEHQLPPGLRLLGDEVEPWTASDGLLMPQLMFNDLSFWNQRPEEERFRWLVAFGVDGVRDLLGDPEVHLPEAIASMAAELAADLETVSTGDSTPLIDSASPGSNNWTIGPSRTASGQPMLANDPHLGLRLPSVWYQAQLRAPGYEAAGMTLPGTPGVVIGRGPHVAWAFTNTMLDDHDVFFERLDEAGENYQRGDAWLPLESERVDISLRGGGSVELTLEHTDLGPLLPADPQLGLPARSLAWTGHRVADPFAALRALAASRSPDDLTEALDSYIGPAQNLVAAFDSGEILFTIIGRVPERRTGDGRLPSAGWDIAYGWDGLRPRTGNPVVRSPENGILVTANSDHRPLDFALPMTADYFGPWRSGRIEQLLSSHSDWTREAFADVQDDVQSIFALELIELLAIAGPFDGDAGRALSALRDWDGEMALNGPSALYILVERHLLESIFGDDSERYGFDGNVGDRAALTSLLRGDLLHDARWYDDVETEVVEDGRQTLTSALELAWREGASRWGDDVSDWDYGWLHSLTLQHPLNALPVFGAWTRRGPFPVAGSATTIAAFGARWQDDGRQRVTFGPSMRWVVDWSDPDRAWAKIPGGQSGHPNDLHYGDQIQPFLRGEMHEAPWSDVAIEALTVQRLTLTPSSRR